jgi:hypothetical protein
LTRGLFGYEPRVVRGVTRRTRGSNPKNPRVNPEEPAGERRGFDTG